ncbi:MAG TPA: hypothetical protein DCE78_00985 [Bacteroidetes bacterium]|nr:hypothetical protein [Bacteroidota bacterium]
MIVYMFDEGSKPNDPDLVSTQLNNLRRDMVMFLKYQHGADEIDAMDATQETLYILFKMWKKNELDNVKAHKAYMFKILRNQYFKMIRDRSMYSHEPIESYLEKIESNTVEDFSEKENIQLLTECITKLSSKHQKYINYWLNNQNPNTIEFSEKFDISTSNAWTIKHRLITILKKCVLKKLNGYVGCDKSGGKMN